MLFTTATFTFLFLPVVLAAFYAIGRRSARGAAVWLFAASVFFYGYWTPRYTILLLGSICVNFVIGRRIAGIAREAAGGAPPRRRWLVAGVTFNLLLLGYFKYANFFVASLQNSLGLDLAAPHILLPIGISFFTFTQIAFLADTYQKDVSEYKFSHYGLFVTYFPHLVAGPVLHHAQMMPQFNRQETYRFQLANTAAGLGIFALGLVKKVVIADYMSPFADAIFDAASHGAVPTSSEAWLGSLAYTFQLYFDFSGYSDMAIGLSWMMNVRLPFNFDSPYKSLSISEFWRRWHMTLSTFLRDYLYIPLGGNRHGPVRRYLNLAITMLLGGLWHGASWTFVWWGGLHGIYLGVNHAFRAALGTSADRLDRSLVFRLMCWTVTFLSVVVAWVFFRATTFVGASSILRSMLTTPALGASAAANRLLWNAGLGATNGFIACVLLGAVACAAPNSNRIGEWLRARCDTSLPVRAAVVGFALTVVTFLVILNESRSSVSAFIYFNF